MFSANHQATQPVTQSPAIPNHNQQVIILQSENYAGEGI